jgi:hypothetical protein
MQFHHHTAANMTKGPYLVTIRVVPDGDKFAVVTYVDGVEVDRLGGCAHDEALRAAKDLESMLVQTGGKLPPGGVQ